MTTKQPAALFDFDLTLTDKDSFMLFARFLMRHCPGAWMDGVGLLAKIIPYGLGVLSKEHMKSQVLAMLGRRPKEAVDDIVYEFVRDVLPDTYRFRGIEKLDWHRQAGHITILASASPDLYLEPISRELGFDVLVCTSTNKAHPPVLEGANCLGVEKVKRLQQLEVFDQIDWKESFAYSDHISDLPMFMLCGHPVAANPSRALQSYAKQAGWEIANWR